MKMSMKILRAPFPRLFFSILSASSALSASSVSSIFSIFARTLAILLLLVFPLSAPASEPGETNSGDAHFKEADFKEANFEFRGTINAQDPVSRLLKRYVEDFSPEALFLEIDEQPEEGRFRDLYMDLRGVLIGEVRVDRLIFRMNDVRFNDPSEWPENIECLSALQIYAYCSLKEDDINRHLEAKTFGQDGHWKGIVMKISPSGLYARGTYSADLLFFSLNILLEVESGLRIVDNRELWLDNYKVRVNTLGVPDYVTRKAVAQIQPILDLGRFPLPLRLHNVEFGEGEAVLSTRILPEPLQKGIVYHYHREH